MSIFPVDIFCTDGKIFHETLKNKGKLVKKKSKKEEKPKVGRPPKPANEVLSERFEIRLAAAERQELERIAEASDTTVTLLIRTAINEYVKKVKK